MNINLAYDRDFGDNAALISAGDLAAFRYLVKNTTPDVSAFLAEMEYAAFLRSIYWQVVRIHVLKQRGHRCSRCGKKSGIHVHHESYKHHGREHRNLDDLTILCSDCHALMHVDDGKAVDALAALAAAKRMPRLPEPVENMDYNPHALKHYMFGREE